MRRIGLAALAVLAACNGTERETLPERDATASADQVAPAVAAQTCAQFPQDEDDGTATRPEVPATLASFVTATETTVTIERHSGTPACIDISYGQVDRWDSFAQGRLLGVGISGHEYNSYLVVDRNGTAGPVETGRAPAFSPDGTRFASVDVSEAAFGAFEALGVWEVTGSSIRNMVAIEELLDRGSDWRLEQWASNDCLVFSTAADPSGIDLKERNYHELRLTDRPALKDVGEGAACRLPV